MRRLGSTLTCRIPCHGASRWVRIKAGAKVAGEAKELPFTKSLEGFTTGLEDYRATEAIWEAPTIQSAWQQVHDTLGGKVEVDEEQREAIVEKDLIGLAVTTARAELEALLMILPPGLRQRVQEAPTVVHDTMEEIFVHLGMEVEVRGSGWSVMLPPPSFDDIQQIARGVSNMSSDGRGCIQGSLHRVSAWRNRDGQYLGFTMRIGRYVPNAAKALVPLAQEGNLLILSPPGMGKTTVLRDLAVALSREEGRPRVIVVDTSNEIGGDSQTPLPYLGRVRRLQVPRREDQQRIMSEALGNHTPDCIIIDEIASAEEANTAWTMSQRGVRLVATGHGESLDKLALNRELNMLVGGAAQAFLSHEERRFRAKVKKTVLERPYPSPFDFVVQLTKRDQGVLFFNVGEAVDSLFNGVDPETDGRLCARIQLSEPLPDRVRRKCVKRNAAVVSDNASRGEPQEAEEQADNKKRGRFHPHHGKGGRKDVVSIEEDEDGYLL